MYRTIPLLLLLTLLAACAGPAAPEETDPQILTERYQTAIENARDADTNQALPVLDATDPDSSPYLELLGLTDDDLTAGALSVSLMNVKAYGIAVLRPADGREENVREGLQSFIDLQNQNFQQYLPDQYEIARSARLETLADGTVVLVMCPDQDAVLESIRSELEEAA